MRDSDYFAAPGVNKSSLWELTRSPAHYRWALEHPRADTAALLLGRALHAAILTPTAFRRDFAVLPEDLDRRTKAGRAAWDVFVTENRGKTILTHDDAETVKSIAQAVKSNPQARELLKGTRREVALFWTDAESGLPCKAKLDAVRRGLILDLKTTTDASLKAFTRDVVSRGYDVQAAHYLDGHRARYGEEADFFFIAVEKTPPFAVAVYRLDEGFVEYGERRRRELLDKLAECRENDFWPGYGEDELILPGYLEN